MKTRLLFDLDRTILEAWTADDFTPRPVPWLDRLKKIQGEPVAICTNQGGIPWNLAGGRPGKKYPDWPGVVARIRAGMELIGVRLAFVALHHPDAPVPAGNLLWERGKAIGLPPILIRLVGTGMGAIVPMPDNHGYIVASWSPHWRKPAPGMLLVAKRLLGNDRWTWAYVGDEDSDRQAARAAGMDFIDVQGWTR